MENEEKKISVFGAAKLKTTTKSAKEDKPIVKATGLEQKLVGFAELNGELSDAKAQLGAVTDEIKTISREKFVELYKQNKENPHTFLIQAGEECIMVIPSDKYEKVADEARAEQLIKEYGKDVVTISERFYFNPAVIERNSDAIKKLVDDLIVNAKNISEADKTNLLTKEISYAVTKGTIDNLVEYSKKSGNDIATVVENIRPIFQLKNCGGGDEEQKAEGGKLDKGWTFITDPPLITGWSECHWSPLYNDSNVCPVCGERTHVLSDDELRDQMEGSEESEQRSEARHYDEGGSLNEELQVELDGLNSALPYVEGEEKSVIEARIKEIQDLAKPAPKAKARVQAHEPASHTPSAPAEKPLEEKKIEEKKPLTGMFSAAKVKPVTKKSAKAEKITISIPELESQIALRKTLKAEFEDLDSQQSAMASEIKQIAIEKFVELYKQSQRNPETFLIQDGQGCVMVLPVDNYIKIDEDKAKWLTGIYGDKIVTVSEFYYFNTEVLQRNQPAIEAIIGDAAISDQDKENLLLREITYTVTKGLIDNMYEYGKKLANLLEDVHPTFMLKACSEKKAMGGTFETGGDLRDELILDVPVLMGYSNCCYAPVYGETDICTNCGEHCIVLSEEEARNEIAETANEMATGGKVSNKGWTSRVIRGKYFPIDEAEVFFKDNVMVGIVFTTMDQSEGRADWQVWWITNGEVPVEQFIKEIADKGKHWDGGTSITAITEGGARKMIKVFKNAYEANGSEMASGDGYYSRTGDGPSPKAFAQGKMAAGGGMKIKVSGYGSEIEKAIHRNTLANIAKYELASAKKYLNEMKRTGDSTLISFAQRKYDEVIREQANKKAHGGVMTAQKEFEISSGPNVYWGMYHYEGNKLFMDSCETMDKKGNLVNVLDKDAATQDKVYALLEDDTKDEIRGADYEEYAKGGGLEGWEQRALDLKTAELAKLEKEEAKSPTPKMKQWLSNSNSARIKRITHQIENLKKLIDKKPKLAEGGGLIPPRGTKTDFGITVGQFRKPMAVVSIGINGWSEKRVDEFVGQCISRYISTVYVGNNWLFLIGDTIDELHRKMPPPSPTFRTFDYYHALAITDKDVVISENDLDRATSETQNR